MKTKQKEMTTVSVGAEPRSGVPETNFNVISLPDPQAKSKNYFCLRKLQSERDQYTNNHKRTVYLYEY